MNSERIFIIGGTGNIGKALVDALLLKNAKVTLYARNPAKVASMFPIGENITTIKGDLSTLNELKHAFQGHTRLFIVINDFSLPMYEVKKTIATYAYEAGIQQVVDVSTITAGYPYRTVYSGYLHYESERAVLEIPNRNKYVALRPGRFMSNMLTFDRVGEDGVFCETQDPNEYIGWISPNDIGAVAAAVLTEDVEKHGDAVYELVGDRVTQAQRADMLSRVLGRKVTYQQVDPADKYEKLVRLGFPHLVAYGLACNPVTAPADGLVTPGFRILIGKGPETLEEYSIKNKDLL